MIERRGIGTEEIGGMTSEMSEINESGRIDMKASELKPGQFFEFVGETGRRQFIDYKIDGRCWYIDIDSKYRLWWCGGDCEVTPLAVTGWDDEPQSDGPSIAKQLNIDAGTEQFELARALHRVVRAMHDGHCPKCGHLACSMEFEPSEGYHACPNCEFAITKEESDEALAMFLPYMQKNYDKFAAWQLHGRFIKPIAEVPPPVEPPQPEQFKTKSSLACESMDPCDCMIRQWVGKCPHERIDYTKLAADIEAKCKEIDAMGIQFPQPTQPDADRVGHHVRTRDRYRRLAKPAPQLNWTINITR